MEKKDWNEEEKQKKKEKEKQNQVKESKKQRIEEACLHCTYISQECKKYRSTVKKIARTTSDRTEII